MALSKLDSLYKAVVTDHSAHPHHHGKLEDVEQVVLNNPTCGDVISLSVKFNDKDEIEDIAFVNSGCTISTASASMDDGCSSGQDKRAGAGISRSLLADGSGPGRQSPERIGRWSLFSRRCQIPAAD